MTQTVMTIIAEIDPARISELRKKLSRFGSNPGGTAQAPIAKVPTLHFSSMVIFDRPERGQMLVWENNFDGTTDAYIKDVLDAAEPDLRPIYECCDFKNAGSLGDYLKARVVPAGLYHIGAPGRTAKRIREESDLRDALQDRLRANTAHTAVQAAQQIRDYIRNSPQFSWAITPEAGQPFGDIARAWIGAIFAVILIVITFPILAIIGIVIRVQELFNYVDDHPITHDDLQRQLAAEDWCAQNHMASLTRVKPGLFRWLFVKVLLRLGNLIVRIQNRGTLGGIPGIHYAHWSLIDNGCRLLFLSNYTGSWTSYLDDFITQASQGLSLVWSNTGGFPRTKWLFIKFLFRGGAQHSLLFKTYARNSQSPALVWYSAYPDLAVQTVNRNTHVRKGLSSGNVESEDQQAKWLRTL